MEKDISEIAKLTERISKDPKSKLFVPLAEEYKKIGDMEMAIHVLMEGLKSNPGYVTARSILGRLYFDNGDLANAQKEFEEVVQSVPDNLIAQRKLGDLYILLDRPKDAIKQYTIALSLNPKDAEFASLIADVEAGKDVRSRVQRPQTKSSMKEKAAQQPVKTPVKSPATSRPVRPDAIVDTDTIPPLPETVEESPAPVLKTTQPVVREEPASLPTPAPVVDAAIMMEEEEAEEVLIVEPLEPEPVEQEASKEEPSAAVMPVEEPAIQEMPAPDLPETGLDARTEDDNAALQPETFEEAFSAEVIEPVPTSEQNADDIITIPDVFSEKPQETAKPEPSTDFAMDEIPGVETGEIPIAEPAATEDFPVADQASKDASGAASDTSDDFTTDTLAELYIGQGFYEKAIDIYERMLAENPSSRGLKEKLERVREAAALVPGTEAEGTPIETTASERTAVKSVPAASEEAVERPVLAEPKEYQPPPGSDREPSEGTPSPAMAAEAREYVPPVEAEEIVIGAEVTEDSEGTARGDAFSYGGMLNEPVEYTQPVKRDEQRPGGGDAGFDIFATTPAGEKAADKPSLDEFEAREYVPDQGAQPPAASQGNEVPLSVKAHPAGHKETIDRLESWLRNIQKEK